MLGWLLRNPIIFRKKRNISPWASNRPQSSHVVGLSILYGLGFPPCVCRNSSPARNIGVLLDSSNKETKFLTCLLRRLITSVLISSSPSRSPQFQLSGELYETKSYSVS